MGLTVVDKWIAKGHGLRLHIVTQDVLASAICYGSLVEMYLVAGACNHAHIRNPIESSFN